MPPKSKDGSKKATSPKEKDKKPVVNTETLCDENWICNVVFIYEGDKEGNNFMNLLQQIPTKQVTCVKIVSKNDVMKEVKKGGGKAPKKPDSKGKGKEEQVALTDEQKVMKCVKENNSIPGAPLANIIKKVLISLKVEDINERLKEQTAFQKAKQPQSKGNKKGVKAAKEEVSDNEAVEDKFVEKPPLFVVLFGFSEHDLPAELLKLDVPLRAVMKLTGKCSPDTDVTAEKKSDETEDRSLSLLGSDKFNMTWLKFWRKFDTLMDIPEYADLGNDMAVIPYRVPQELMNSKVNLKDKKTIVVNQLSEIMNYIQTILERYDSYSKNVEVIDMGEPELLTENQDVYDTLVEMVPLECISIPVILFSLVEQVCHWNGDEIEVENENDSIDDNNKKRKSQPPLKPIKCRPALIRHNDEHSLRTFHLEIPEIDFNRIINRVLSKLYLFSPWLNDAKQDQMLKYYLEFHLQRLWKSTFRTIHLKLFYIYFHWFILCKMKVYYMWYSRNKRSSKEMDSNKCIESFDINFLNKWLHDCGINEQTEIPDIVLDNLDNDPNENQSQTDINNSDDINEEGLDSSKIQNNVNEEYLHNDYIHDYKTASSITRSRNRSLLTLKKFLYCPEIYCLCESDEFPRVSNSMKLFASNKFIEEMPSEALLQAVQEALFNYSEVHHLYYHPSNKILLWFHNSKHLIFEKTISGQLNTPLGFRDYYSSVIEPEERYASLLNQNETTAEIDGHNHHQQSDTENISRDANEYSSREDDELFYNLGKKKVLFHEFIKRYVADDGTSVTVKIDDWYRSSQYINICISKVDTEMHLYLDKLVLLDEDSDEYELKSNVPNESMKVMVKFPNESMLNVKVEELTDLGYESVASPSWFIYKDLIITLPTGLTIEVVNNIYNNNEIYIKQSYTAKGPNSNKIWDEDCRCFTNSGAVIIFRNDNTIDVLYSNTGFARVNKIEIDPHEEEVIVPEVVVEEKKEKPKKGIKKGKSKEKDTPVTEVPQQEKEVVKKLPYKIMEHVIKSWSGISYSFKGNICDEIVDNKVNLRTIFDPYKRLYIDRNDGIKCLFMENGDLVATFSDNTMLTTYCYEDPEPIDMSKPDPDSEFVDANQDNEEKGKGYSKHQSFSFDVSSYISQNEDDIPAIPGAVTDETYVAYMMGCIAEHPNYATVEFRPDTESIKLVLPGELTVIIQNIQSDGTYNFTATVDKKTILEFNEQNIDFRSNIMKKSKHHNVTTILPLLVMDRTIEEPSYFCRTTDSANCLFMVSKYGEVKLTAPQNETDETKKKKVSTTSSKDCDHYYYEHDLPNKIMERFFVVNDNFTGYEIINENDVSLLEKQEESKYNNTQIVKNPTNNRIQSKTCQHLVYNTHSNKYLLPQLVQFSNILPNNFQRADLSPIWTHKQSPWFFISSDRRTAYRQFSYSNIQKHSDKAIQAVVSKTIQQVSNTSDFNGLEIIINCLEKYKLENEKLSNKYKQQGFTDYDIDFRMKENHELASSMKKGFPLWNVLRKDCNVCKQSFGCPTKTVAGPVFKVNVGGINNSASTEKVINKINY